MCGTADGTSGVHRESPQKVTAFWKSLGLPGIVDIHTHFMPDRVLRKVWAFFDAVGENYGQDWPITYRFDEDQRLELLRAFGVRRFTALVYPHKAGMAAWLNQWAADFAARTPDVLPTATFFPEPEAAEYVAAALRGGVRIFKSHLEVGGYDPNDPLLDPVWGMLADSATPVVAHCSSGLLPGKFTGPGPIGGVLARFPRLRLIVAHLGMPEYTEFFDLAERYPGVLLDTTLAFTDFTEVHAPFPAEELPRLRDLGDRVLLGSDFPNMPYPYAEGLAALARLDLGEDWLRAVCHDNAVRLLDLG